MVENVNRTHFILTNKLIKRSQNNLDLYSLDSKDLPILGDRTHIPIKTIDELYILKKCIIDTETLSFLSDNNIVVHFFSRNQRATGNFFPNSKNSVNKSGFCFLQQLRAFDNLEHRLYIAKQITKGHIKNMMINLKYYKIKNNLSENYKLIDKQNSIQEIMGVEGISKKEYYECWNQIITNQKSFKFIKRSKRPPADKINVLISYFNSRVYNICLCEIYKTELDPRISFLHEPNYRNLSLHLDIAEIFKPILDRTIFTILNKKILKDSHFAKENGLWNLTSDGIKIIELEIIKRLSKIKDINGMQLNLRYIILKEVNNLKKCIIEYSEYTPYENSS